MKEKETAGCVVETDRSEKSERHPVQRSCRWQRVESRAIDWLRFPLAVGVVLIHAYGVSALTPAAMEGAHPLWVECCKCFRSLLSQWLPAVAVPAFFLISGRLFFKGVRHLSREVYFTKLRRRFFSLAIPYFLWNVIALVVQFLRLRWDVLTWDSAFEKFSFYVRQKGGWSVFWDSQSIGRDTHNWFGFPVEGLTAPVDVPLWFVRELMVLALLSPVIGWLLRRLRWRFLLLLMLCYVLSVWHPVHGLSTTAALFFSLGAWVSMTDRNLVELCRPHYRLSAVLLPVMLTVNQFFSMPAPISGTWQLMFLLVEIVLAVNVAASLSARRRWCFPAVLTGSVFVIYAAHTVEILRACDEWLKRCWVVDTPGWLTLRYLLVVVIAIALCVLLNEMLRRLCPFLHRLLSGKR